LRAMHKGCLYITGRRRAHHEAAVCGLIQTHACISIVHIRDDLFGIEQNDKMLGQKSESANRQVFLRKPHSPTFGNAELGANNAHIYIREFAWIANRICAPRTGNLGNRGANHLCRGMERGQSCLRLGSVLDVVRGATGSLKVFFKKRLEVRARLREDGNLRMLYSLSRNVGADGRKNQLPAIVQHYFESC